MIHAGCRLFGKSTLIMGQTQIGYESPVTIQDCQLGPRVALKGGFFKESVFLEKASAGSGSHVREGCIFEEEAKIAHTVGLKQTILFPFVTLGSLINFCDCLMAGGTSRKNHSEVGSAYIHFNFTPNQDKATPSLVGDVPKGVMLDQLPIFLGGQGGLVGPSRLAFGTVIAAGTIFRKDEIRPGRMLFEGAGKGGNDSLCSRTLRGNQTDRGQQQSLYRQPHFPSALVSTCAISFSFRQFPGHTPGSGHGKIADNHSGTNPAVRSTVQAKCPLSIQKYEGYLSEG